MKKCPHLVVLDPNQSDTRICDFLLSLEKYFSKLIFITLGNTKGYNYERKIGHSSIIVNIPLPVACQDLKSMNNKDLRVFGQRIVELLLFDLILRPGELYNAFFHNHFMYFLAEPLKNSFEIRLITYIDFFPTGSQLKNLKQNKKNKENELFDLNSLILFERSDILMCNSEILEKVISSSSILDGFPTTVCKFNLPFPPEMYRKKEGIRMKLGLDEEDTVILVKIDEDVEIQIVKLVELIVQQIGLLKLRILLVGDCDYSIFLNTFTEGIKNRISFLGRLVTKDFLKHLQASDYFVSLVENNLTVDSLLDARIAYCRIITNNPLYLLEYSDELEGMTFDLLDQCCNLGSFLKLARIEKGHQLLKKEPNSYSKQVSHFLGLFC